MDQPQGVCLPEPFTGSSFFHAVLHSASQAFPEALGPAALPDDARAFKKSYAQDLVRFEAARVNAAERVDIARFLAQETVNRLELEQASGRRPLLATLQEDEAPIGDEVCHTLTGSVGLVPRVPFRDRTYEGGEVNALIDLLDEENLLSGNARDGLRWVVEEALAHGGRLDLSGQRFVMLGAGAELAPTVSLLRAGATVLWVDLSDPLEALARRVDLDTLAGEVVTVEGARDLLQQPAGVLAAIRRFSGGEPVHLGLFAYAPGKGRELRLAGAMAALTEAMDPALLRSVCLYISPTIPASVQPGCRERTTRRVERLAWWQRWLSRLGAMGADGHVAAEADIPVSRSIVGLQGPGYQAAQYLTKIAVAERWATQPDGPAVSANIAGITRTRSLEHPLFQVAFAGAPTFEIQIFDPETTRPLSALLLLRDLLDPDAPTAARPWTDPRARAAAALSSQIHGGVYVLPWDFDATIRVATVVGATRSPGLLFRR